MRPSIDPPVHPSILQILRYIYYVSGIVLVSEDAGVSITERLGGVGERPVLHLPLQSTLKSQVQSSDESSLWEGKGKCVFEGV